MTKIVDGGKKLALIAGATGILKVGTVLGASAKHEGQPGV